MAITYVGGVTGGRAGATSTTTQSLSATLGGGSDTSPSPGDLVVVWVSAAGSVTYKPTSQLISGDNNGAYTYTTFQSANDTNYSLSQLNYKIQGATVDTSLTIPSSGDARCAQRWVVHVFRGVHPVTPLDVAAVPKTGIDTGRPNPDPITPSTSGAWIAAYYASAAATGAAYTSPGLSGWLGNTTADTYDVMQGGGYYSSWSSGAYDPAAITAGGTTGTGDAWTAMTIALRPNYVPTIALGNPADTATGVSVTPQLYFTGSDGNTADTLEYNVQVDTVTTFDSVGAGFDLKYVDLYLRKGFGTPTDNLLLDIRSTSFSGPSLGQSNAVAQTLLSSSSSDIRFTFATPITLSVDTKYYMTLSRSGARDISNYSEWSYSAVNPYAGGEYSVKNSGIWTDDAGCDFRFKIYDTNTNVVIMNNTGTLSAAVLMGDGGGQEQGGQSFTVANTNPLISSLSTTDAGFTAGHPYTQGVEKSYTVQSALDAGTQYFWRARAIDPDGSNTYSSWPTTKSFTTTGGSPVNASITQVAATITATGNTQAVVGNVAVSASITQVAASLAISVGTQVVNAVAMVSSAISQLVSSLTLSTGTQVVAGVIIASASISQVAGATTLTGGTQAVSATDLYRTSSITQVAASVVASGQTQVVNAQNNIANTQLYGSVTLTGGTQAVASIENSAISQSSQSLGLTGGTQSVATTQLSSIAQSVVALILSGGIQEVSPTAYTYANGSLTQVSTALTLTGNTQEVVGTVIDGSDITQIAGTLTLSGGTQAVSSTDSYSTSSISQIAASVVVSGQTQAVASQNNISNQQLYGSVTITGGTQVVASVQNSAVTQTSQALTLTGNTQSVASTQLGSVAQSVVAMNLSGGTQAVATVNNFAVTQVAANVTLTGQTQSVATVRKVALTQIVGEMVVEHDQTTTPTITTSNIVNITQVKADLTLTGGTQVPSAVAAGSVNIVQAAQAMTVTGGTQEVSSVVIASSSISQLNSALNLSGGTQAVSTVNNTALSQLVKDLTLTGGVQSVASQNYYSDSQTSTSLTLTGGTQSVSTSQLSSITQESASLLLTGGTQGVTAEIAAGSTSIAQTSALLELTGGTQVVEAVIETTGASITQTYAELTVSSGTQIISTSTGYIPLPDYSLIFVDGKLAIQMDEDQYMSI